jgi:hypothetical protein
VAPLLTPQVITLAVLVMVVVALIWDKFGRTATAIFFPF